MPFIENVVRIRRAIYDLQRKPNASVQGPTRAEIVNYAIARKWPDPSQDFDDAIERLTDAPAKARTIDVPVTQANERHYRLTHYGLAEEEFYARRRRLLRTWDEMRQPERLATAAFTIGVAVLIFFLGVVFGPHLPSP